MTLILLGVIALIGIISIIIVKIYYKDKDKDRDKERLEDFLNSSDYNSTIESHENISSRRQKTGSKTVKNIDKKPVQRRRKVRKVPKEESGNEKYANLTAAQVYANTLQNASNEDLFGDYYDEPIKDAKTGKPVSIEADIPEANQANGTVTLLRKRAEAAKQAEEKPVQKKKIRRVQKVKADDNAAKQVPRTPERVKEQMNKEDEVKSFQEPITKKHKETINSLNQPDAKVKSRQVPMTKEQKEFISAETAKKLIVEDSEGDVKLVKSVKPDEDIEEIKEAAKIEEAEEKAVDMDEAKVEETTSKLVEKAEKVLGTETEETPKAETTEEVKAPEAKTPKVEEAKEAEAPKVEAKEEVKTPKAKTTEEVKVPETETPKAETLKAEKESKAIETPKAEETTVKEETTAENTYQDDLNIILGKEVKEDKSPENEFLTINSDEEEEGNDLIRDAIQSIRNFRSSNTSKPKDEPKEIKDEFTPDDYVHNFGNGIEEFGDTITITPIHEEEARDLAYNQPNEDVDKVYKEINDESYNKTDDDELDKSFEDVTDESSEKDANVYTKEDYIKAEKAEEEKKIRAENTKKILDLKGEGDKKASKARKAEKPKADRKVPEEKTPEGQKRLVFNQPRSDVEEVYINGTLYELKVGQTIMFNHNNESYSSQILKLKPGYVGVKYRSKKVWIKATNVKKIL